jgi:hypothetical protein
VAGTVIADAVRFGGGTGDIVRPGPNSISGYPRDEESQRYFAERTLGFDGVGFDSYIWDIEGYLDISDNVRCAAKWAAEMNQTPAGGVQVDRWKRVYLEFHSNAGGASRGQFTLITDITPTANQEDYALILSNEFDADMLIADEDFEHTWSDRASPTYTGTYGAITVEANADEFDATIVEVAYHDNQIDAELMRDPRVRAAMARASVHGMIKFLNTLPGSQVPLAFAPDTPTYVRAEDLGGGDVRVSWEPPLSDEARGEPATGYVVYQSPNGYGFGEPIVVGDVRSVTLSNVPVGETRYFRVAATNAGGESLPSPVMAVRRPATGVGDILIVSAFDRQRRQIDPVQTFTQPALYAGQSIDRPIWRRNNSFDYAVQYAESLAVLDEGFASATTESVQYSYVDMDDYAIVHWIAGQESTEDVALSSLERTRLQSFLVNGGSLLISGSDLAFDVDAQSGGTAFLNDVLRVDYASDNAATYTAISEPNSIFQGVMPLSFDPADGAVYDTKRPDVLAAGTDAEVALTYGGAIGGPAAIQYAGPIYHVVTMGFPFEALATAGERDEVMARVMIFLRSAPGLLPFDWDRDADVDIDDFNVWGFCAGNSYPQGSFCLEFDGDGDMDVDIADFYLMQLVTTGAK